MKIIRNSVAFAVLFGAIFCSQAHTGVGAAVLCPRAIDLAEVGARCCVSCPGMALKGLSRAVCVVAYALWKCVPKKIELVKAK